MDYDSFLLVAQKAVDVGCSIVKEDLDSGKVTESKDVSIVTPYGKVYRTSYYFHLLEAGDIKINIVNGKEFLDRGYTASGNAIIETGYYDENEEYIPRTECLTKVYDALSRYVKKIAPRTEIIDVRISKKHEDYGKEYEYRDKVYITKVCLDMVQNEGYKLC